MLMEAINFRNYSLNKVLRKSTELLSICHGNFLAAHELETVLTTEQSLVHKCE
jgi:hypothetical protein